MAIFTVPRFPLSAYQISNTAAGSHRGAKQLLQVLISFRNPSQFSVFSF